MTRLFPRTRPSRKWCCMHGPSRDPKHDVQPSFGKTANKRHEAQLLPRHSRQVQTDTSKRRLKDTSFSPIKHQCDDSIAFRLVNPYGNDIASHGLTARSPAVTASSYASWTRQCAQPAESAFTFACANSLRGLSNTLPQQARLPRTAGSHTAVACCFFEHR